MLEKHEPESSLAEDYAAIKTNKKDNENTVVAIMKYREK